MEVLSLIPVSLLILSLSQFPFFSALYYCLLHAPRVQHAYIAVSSYMQHHLQSSDTHFEKQSFQMQS